MSKKRQRCHVANSGCTNPANSSTASTTWECPRCGETTCKACRVKVGRATVCANCEDDERDSQDGGLAAAARERITGGRIEAQGLRPITPDMEQRLALRLIKRECAGAKGKPSARLIDIWRGIARHRLQDARMLLITSLEEEP